MNLLSGDFSAFRLIAHYRLQRLRAPIVMVAMKSMWCALPHDIGDTLGTYNHSEVAAAILKPFCQRRKSLDDPEPWNFPVITSFTALE